MGFGYPVGMSRVGFGYDSHRFDPTRPLMLGGVLINDAPGLAGHSDADAVLHAVIDAMLGAAGAGDIGDRFPDTDSRWAAVASSELVDRTVDEISGRGWRVTNCDITILAERPVLASWKAPMRERIAELLGLRPAAVSVKAKTSEGMGPIGRGEGIAVMAAVLLEPAT